MFLDEFRYVIKERKIPNYIAKDIKISSDESDTEDIDEENSVDKHSNKGSFDEENHHSRPGILLKAMEFHLMNQMNLMNNNVYLINAQKSLSSMIILGSVNFSLI